jgi:hypothetical protein
MRSAVLAIPFIAAAAGVGLTMEAAAQDGPRSFVWDNGDSFTGTFRNGRPNGHGVYRTAAGQVHEGEWREGCLVGDQGYRIALFTKLADCPKTTRRNPPLPRQDFFR